MSHSLGRINWRRLAVAAVLLLLTAMLLGATVFREQVAQAAQAVLQVNVVNPASSPVPVSQKGTADVNVTNSSLTVKPPAPVTSGGQRFFLGPRTADLGDPSTASALVIHFRDGASELVLFSGDQIAARFPGPGPLVLGLTQPVQFDRVQCIGPAGSECDFGWAGSAG